MHLPPDWVEVVPPGWGMQGKSYYKNSSLMTGGLDETSCGPCGKKGTSKWVPPENHLK